MAAAPSGRHWAQFAPGALLLAGLWLVIAGTDPGAWLIGVPAIAAATWASHVLRGPVRPPRSPWRALRFAAFFLRESLRGGIDVAARTLGPRLRIDPGFVTYRCGLPPGRPRVLFANCVSLLPGTLAADLKDAELSVHVLDTGSDTLAELRRLEAAVADLFHPTAVAGDE